MEKHLEWFEAYARRKIAACTVDAAPIELKLEHTLNVLANAREIAQSLGARESRVLQLAALYHDLARFDQFLEYDTFKDKDSRDHGAWSARLLRRHNRLSDEDPWVRQQVMLAVTRHNKRGLPRNLPQNTLLFCGLLRDADKLDILRVMDKHLSGPKPYNPTVILSLPDDPALFGPRVIEAALSRTCASYGDLRSVNDFRLLLATWYFDLHSPTSKRLFIEAGHARNLLIALPDDHIYGEAKKYVLGCMATDVHKQGDKSNERL